MDENVLATVKERLGTKFNTVAKVTMLMIAEVAASRDPDGETNEALLEQITTEFLDRAKEIMEEDPRLSSDQALMLVCVEFNHNDEATKSFTSELIRDPDMYAELVTQ